MPAPVHKNVIVASSRPRRPDARVQCALPTEHAVKDDSWMIFGVMALVLCGLVGAFFLGRAASAPAGVPLARIALAPPLPPSPMPTPAPPMIHRTHASRPAAPALDYVAPRMTTTARFYTPSPVAANVPLPTPVDYAAKDRRIHELQREIDGIDAQMLQIRTHPGERWQWGIYDGPNNRYDDGSAMKRVLDRLDEQRNGLRREKWRLEGR